MTGSKKTDICTNAVPLTVPFPSDSEDEEWWKALENKKREAKLSKMQYRREAMGIF